MYKLKFNNEVDMNHFIRIIRTYVLTRYKNKKENYLTFKIYYKVKDDLLVLSTKDDIDSIKRINKEYVKQDKKLSKPGRKKIIDEDKKKYIEKCSSEYDSMIFELS